MEDQVRARIRESLAVVPPHPALRSRVMASIPYAYEAADQPRRRWRLLAAGPAVALLLAAALVLTLTHASLLSRSQPGTQPGLVDRGTAEVVSANGLHCRLPVIVEGPGQTPLIGFLSLPDGKLLADPSVHQTGSLKGLQSYSYDQPLNRWLPVSLSGSISPDGKNYAYTRPASPTVTGQTPTLSMVLVDARSGAETEVWSGPSNFSSSPAFYNGLLYFIEDSTLYSVDPAHPSSVRTVATVPGAVTLSRFGAGALWLPTGRPEPSVPKLTGKDVVRIDVRDGSQTTVYTAPDGYYVDVVTVDNQGRALLRLNTVPTVGAPARSPAPGQTSGPSYKVLVAPGQAVDLSGGPGGYGFGYGVAGSEGVWLASAESLWLWSRTSVREVARVHYSQLWTAPSYPPKTAWAAEASSAPARTSSPNTTGGAVPKATLAAVPAPYATATSTPAILALVRVAGTCA